MTKNKMADFSSLLENNAQSSLPSADFSIDGSSDEEEHVQIFNRSDYLQEKGEIANNDKVSFTNSKSDDIIIEDIEEEKEKEDKEMRNVHNESVDNNDTDIEWLKFQSQFQSVLDSSDNIIHETTLAGRIQRLKNELMSIGNSEMMSHNEKGEEELKREEEKGKGDLSPIITKKKVTNSGGNSLLYSSCYDQINEKELDQLLESIKEEDDSTTTNTTTGVPFQWESIISNDKTSNELMNQLELANSSFKEEVEKYVSVLSNNDKGIHITTNINNTTNYLSNDEPVHMDLRPLNNHTSIDDTTSTCEMSQSAKRLMALRLSKSEDTEESYDVDSWKEERQKYKNASSNTHQVVSYSPPSVKNDVRRRHHSCDSISEDDVFATSSSLTITSTEGSSLSEKEESLQLLPNDDNKPSPFSSDKDDLKGTSSVKKRKRKSGGRQRKGSGGSDNEKGRNRKGSEGSDGEGKGGNQKKGKGKKKHVTINQDNRVHDISSSPPSSSRRKKNSSSLTQSSDEDTVINKGPPPVVVPTLPLARSLSEGDAERSRLQLFLQQKIESRKPPSLFNTPNTPPLFHQDVSFTEVLPSLDPSSSLPIKYLLLLPLTEDGLIDMDTVDLPSHSLSSKSIHILHILILTWLIGLTHSSTCTDDSTSTDTNGTSGCLWKPFRVNGLLQTTVDGLAYIIISVAGPSSDDINQLLSQSNLGHIITSLLPLLPSVHTNDVMSSIKSDLQSLYTTPLSCLFTIQSEDTSLLNTPLSFYIHSFYNIHCLPNTEASIQSTSLLQTTLCTLPQSSLTNTSLLFDLLYTATCQGLDISGIRLVYTDSLILAIALRGSDAISRLVDIIGPQDHSLALLTDPNSLSARYKECSINCVHSPYWAKMELAKWFGGRACLSSGTIIGVSDIVTKLERRKRQKVRFSESESEEVIPLPEDIDYPPLISNRPAILAYPYSRLILIASPLITPHCYSTLLNSVSQSGFDLLGIKRLRLNSKRALSLNIPSCCISHFIPSSTPSSPALNNTCNNTCTPRLTPLTNTSTCTSSFPPLPSLLLILGKENANLHSEFLHNQVLLSLNKLTTQFSQHFDTTLPFSDNIHIVELTDDVLKVIGSYTFAPSCASTAKPSLLLLEEKGFKEEMAFLAVPGHTGMKKVLEVLDMIMNIHKDFNESERNDGRELGGFELLGIKIVPNLSRFQAKQLTPYALNSIGFQETVDYLCGKPVTLITLRGINCNERVQKLIKGSENQPKLEIRPGLKQIDVICSEDLNKAFHLTSLFFIDKELFSYPSMWSLAYMVPPVWLNDCAILSSCTLDPDPLLSVFTVSLSRVQLLVKILEKLSRLSFVFVGMNLIKIEREETLLIEEESEDLCIAVCVQRYSAVWYLSHQLQLFTQSSSTYDKAIYYSPNFTSAVNDVQLYFPFGVDSSSPALHKYYQVSLTADSAPSTHIPFIDHYLKPPTSPLSEDAYLILPPSYLSFSSSSSLPFITVLDVLHKARFILIDAFMRPLSLPTVHELCSLLQSTDKESYYNGDKYSLVIGVRRDNAASCFHSIITNSLHQYSIREDTSYISKLFENILVTRTTSQTTAVKSMLKTN